MPQFVEVRFKGNRKAYFEWHESEPLHPPEPVVVEAERGVDYGLVNAIGEIAQKKCDRCTGCALGGEQGRSEDHAPRRPPEPTRRVVRRAVPADHTTHAELRRTEDDVRRKVRDKVQAHGLQMKISDAEWQWDRNKLTVFFTAERRVDFRALVRELASQFRTRIELRQIGVRDEAARLSGIGRCGREYCSASWLPELRPIGLHVAKDQRLSLNPSQISGPCGRLLCCLRFEHEFYVQSRKRFPKEGKILQTSTGAEKVLSLDIFRDRVTLRAEDGTTRTVPLADLKKEVEVGPAAATAPPAGERPQADVARQADTPRPPRRPEGRPRPKAGPEGPPARASAPAPAEAALQGGGSGADARPSGETAAGGSDAGAADRGDRRRRRRRRNRRRGPGGPAAGGPASNGPAQP